MAKRRKAAAVDAPQTMAEALELANLYVEAERTIALSQSLLDKQIALAKSDHAARMEKVEPHLQLAFAGLRAWWSANAAELTKGKRRSIELGPVTLGERTGMPKLKLPKGMKADAALAWLKGLLWDDSAKFIRVKEELDKEAVIKALRANDAAPADALVARKHFTTGEFSVTQAEEFFIRTGEDATPIDMESQTRPTS